LTLSSSETEVVAVVVAVGIAVVVNMVVECTLGAAVKIFKKEISTVNSYSYQLL